jgi:hypothetical protein
VDGTNGNAAFYSPIGLTLDKHGALYVTDFDTIRRISPVGLDWVVTTVGGLSTNAGNADGLASSARFYSPSGISADSEGNLYVSDTYNDTIRFGELVPALNIAVSGNQAFLSWPVTPSSYVLESTSDLSAPSWGPVNASASTNNNVITVTDNLASGMFYRLRQH